MPEICNNLLASLPRKTYRELLPALSSAPLIFGDILYEPGGRMPHVYFPTDSLVSLLSPVDGHLALEVGLVGREGMVGIALALGAKTSAVRALVQGGGSSMRMSRADFTAAMRRSEPLQRGVYKYVHALLQQIARTAACNRFHVVEARLARWLLMTRDRMASSDFPMTQEFLGTMLGVRRVGVTQAASAFQRRRLIAYSRGRIRILDHAGLESASCSCYAAGADAIAPWRPSPAPIPRPVLLS